MTENNRKLSSHNYVLRTRSYVCVCEYMCVSVCEWVCMCVSVRERERERERERININVLAGLNTSHLYMLMEYKK
jgi:hypothetical protein